MMNIQNWGGIVIDTIHYSMPKIRYLTSKAKEPYYKYKDKIEDMEHAEEDRKMRNNYDESY